MVKPAFGASPPKRTSPPSISNDPKLVPDARGVMMYNYGGKIGKVYNPKVVAVEGLRYYHNWQYSHSGDKAKEYFLNSANWLVDNATLKQDGKYLIWEYNFPWMFYGGIKAPYSSALAQTEGAELLAKAYLVTNDERYLNAARKAVAALLIDYDDGGVSSLEDRGDSLFLHVIAKPGFKKVYVLNGHTGALLHLWEYYKITNDGVAKQIFDKGMNYLKNHLAEFDAGDWSYYDKVGTRAMASYQKGHIKQLGYLHEITKDPVVEKFRRRFSVYYAQRQPSNSSDADTLARVNEIKQVEEEGEEQEDDQPI
ncbi:MAG TPA: D-glucuronyl C5-epimerase family protein [Nitrososphaera sp.]